MISLLKQINDLENWDYYEREKEFKLNKIESWNDESEHKKFIKYFLEISGKNVVFEHLDIKLNELSRKIHTNSVYFLGALFYEKLNLKELEKYERNDLSKQFHFIWFLSALVHDFYHDKERKQEAFPEINEDINSIKVENKLLAYIKENKKILEKNEKNEKLFKTIPNYFKYRLRDGKLDHGITTGIKLFDSLEKNRKVRKEQVENGVENSILYWGDDLTPLYAQASLSIAMHNIWSSGEKEEIKEKYRNLGLESLITGESDIFPISIKDNPLLFLLGLVDTIEPIKTFNCLEPQYVLENILIDFDKNKITISNKETSILSFERLIKNVKGLKDWLDVELPGIDNSINKIIIIIKR